MTENAEHIGGKSIAIMQPYLFPYLGYFQLAHSVDEFWLLDTVSFIQHGWMNRNNLMIANTKKLFTIPVSAGPADQVISEKTFARNSVHALNKLQRSVAQSYASVPSLTHPTCFPGFHPARQERGVHGQGCPLRSLST